MITAFSDRSALKIFSVFAGLSLLLLFLSIYFEEKALALIPFGIALVYFSITDLRLVFYLLLFFIPLSIEFQFNSGLGTDLPTEPLMILLMFGFILFALKQPEKIDTRFFKHPLILIFAIHFLWIAIAAVFSINPLVSFKFFLAKIWYIIPFLILPAFLIRSVKDVKTILWIIFLPALYVTIYTLIRHYMYDFRFTEVNKTMMPHFRNHVNYAAFLSLFFPFMLLVRKWCRKYSFQRAVINFGIVMVLAGIIFSYTRGAWLALIVALIGYYLIKKRWLKWGILAAVIALAAAFLYLANNNKYLDYAPEYVKTIYHKSFDKHMKATYKLQDVSTAERVYRWIAAVHMSTEKPLTGYGPGNFYESYKSHTVTLFQTYVSGNPERSGVHNYFLMMLVDQGYIGLAIFVVFIIYLLLKGEAIYHYTRRRMDRQLVMAAMACIIIILVQNFLSDLLEVDKVGPFFFICIALLINQDIKNSKIQTQREVPHRL